MSRGDVREGVGSMRKLPLGNTGVDVSALCLGAMYLGSREDKATSCDLLDQYSQAGGSFIDTANIYVRWLEGFVGGESETLLGEWMKDRGNRDKLFIASKVGFEYQDVERGLGAARILEECEKSLKRLGVDTIDLYYSHVDDRNTPLEETMDAFDKLVKAGKVRFIGASNFLAWRMAEVRSVCAAHNWVDYCCVQQRYTYARPKPGATFAPQISANDDLLDYVKAGGITLLAYSPLLRGAYGRDDREFGKQYLSDDTEARVKVLKGVAAEVGATPHQVVYAWMLASDPAVIPLTAASTAEQMRENLAAADVVLSPEQMAALNTAGTS